MEKLFEDSINKLTTQPGVYYLKINELNYIGSSVNLKVRLLQHRSAMLKGDHENPRLQNTFNKYREDKSWYSVLEVFEEYDQVKLLEAEKKWIDLLGPVLNNKLDPVSQVNSLSQSKTVYQFDLHGRIVGEYKSTKDAERVTKIKSSSIVRVCGGHLKSAGGYLWSYNNRAAVRYDLERSKWKWKPVILVDTLTGESKTYSNIAKAARDVCSDPLRFNSVCATISSLCKGRGKLLNNRYQCSYIGDSGCKTL